MSKDQAPGISCAVCGRGLHLWDVVVVSREVPPSWASPVEQTTTIVHQACEPGEGRADHNWTREAPQTLLHMLVMMAPDGRDPGLEPGGV